MLQCRMICKANRCDSGGPTFSDIQILLQKRNDSVECPKIGRLIRESGQCPILPLFGHCQMSENKSLVFKGLEVIRKWGGDR